MGFYGCALSSGDSPVWGRLLARLIIGELDTALSIDPTYPAILFHRLFHPGGGC